MKILDFTWCAVGVGLNPLMYSRCFSKKICGSAAKSALMKNSPGIRSVVPYNISAGEAWMSSFKLVRSPSSTVDRTSVQGFGEHISADFKVRCHRSIMPFDCG